MYVEFLSGYKWFSLAGGRKGGRGHWNRGINTYIKEDLFKHAQRILPTSEVAVFLVLSGDIMNSNKDILSANVYIPPEGATFYEEENNGVENNGDDGSRHFASSKLL